MLKSSFCVNGIPLIKSYRFIDLQINEMKDETNLNSPTWIYLSETSKTYTDVEIMYQIECVF